MTDPIINIRDALEEALASVDPAIDIVHQGEGYEPLPDRPYCEAYLLPGQPNNATVGAGFYQEQGIFQVTLKYPDGIGTLECATRAGLLRALFKRGATFSSGGVDVQIDRTPELSAGSSEDGHWRQDVRIRWHADIFT
ncbi:phage tail terminator-like protein [Duganella callida]|uniref:DUF3168 domain-containing protein n=1 Tax=Duganella callida TaxID=2561932 RepID=A0A4Y9S3N7_9BURK|nr:phage tail terminator-like protein [Duganella callida]TFW15968.1 hypothetical protein E4L98_25070 [Duganella callida]